MLVVSVPSSSSTDAAQPPGDDFALAYRDIPAEPERGEPGRNLPTAVMRQLCGSCRLLQHGPSGREIRVAVELLMDTSQP